MCAELKRILGKEQKSNLKDTGTLDGRICADVGQQIVELVLHAEILECLYKPSIL